MVHVLMSLCDVPLHSIVIKQSVLVLHVTEFVFDSQRAHSVEVIVLQLDFVTDSYTTRGAGPSKSEIHLTPHGHSTGVHTKSVHIFVHWNKQNLSFTESAV